MSTFHIYATFVISILTSLLKLLPFYEAHNALVPLPYGTCTNFETIPKTGINEDGPNCSNKCQLQISNDLQNLCLTLSWTG